MSERERDGGSLAYWGTPGGSGQGNGWAFGLAFGMGVPAGWVLSFSGFGSVCAGPLFGVVIGVVTALAAQRYRLLFSLLGCGVAVVTCLAFSFARIAGSGGSWQADDFVAGIWMLLLVVAGPGVFCGAMVWRIKTPVR